MNSAWLIDNSAYQRLWRHPMIQDWTTLIHRGLVTISVISLLEIGYSARNGSDWRKEIKQSAVSHMPLLSLTPAIETRALRVQELLADRGLHRAPSIADLLIAATAELSGLAVLTHDKDFGLIAEITGQPVASLNDLPS